MFDFDLQLFNDGAAEITPADTNTALGGGEEAAAGEATGEAAEPSALNGVGQVGGAPESALGGGQQSQAQSEQAAKPLDFTQVCQEFGLDASSELMQGVGTMLAQAGVTDSEQASALFKAHYNEVQSVIGAMAEQRRTQDRDATLQFYGGTLSNPGEKFSAAVSQAGAAIEAISKHVPDFRQAIVDAGLDNNLPMIRALSMLAPLLKEDGNFMHGAGAASRQQMLEAQYPNTDFSKY